MSVINNLVNFMTLNNNSADDDYDDGFEDNSGYLDDAYESNNDFDAVQEQEKEYESFWGICNYPVLEIDGELELEIIESEVLYEIEEREKVSKTEEGSFILKMSDKIFLHILQSDYLYDSLQWRISDNNNRKIYYCMITCNDLYGDECFWPMIANERLHRYSYKNFFKLIQLQLKIEEYQNKYLG